MKKKNNIRCPRCGNPLVDNDYSSLDYSADEYYGITLCNACEYSELEEINSELKGTGRTQAIRYD